jgi:DNA polymerase-3 subunit epsilon
VLFLDIAKPNTQVIYAIIDVESTGGKIEEDAIIDIAILRFDGHRIVDQFHSLVNPEREIQPFVTSLTGITPKMVQTAPKFYELAKRIVEITNDAVLVAHNTQFDYRILKEEFHRLGFDFKSATLCTVELAQRLLKDHESFKLDKLAKALGIPLSNRHRALGDAEATLSLLKILREKDPLNEAERLITRTIKESDTLPSHLEMVRTAADVPGVLQLFGKKDKLVYCAYTTSIKNTVETLLSAANYSKKPLFRSVKKLSYEECPSKLLGLIKTYHYQKTQRPLMRFHIKEREEGEFNDSLNGIIVDKGRTNGESALLKVSEGVLMAYGYTDLNFQSTKASVLEHRLTKVPNDPFFMRIISYQLKQHTYKIIE